MKKSILPRSPKVYITLVCLWAVLVMIMPINGKFNYDYHKGSPWVHETLVAQFDFPILKTQDQLQTEMDEAGSSIIPYYKFSEEVVQTNILSVERLDMSEHQDIKRQIIASLNSIYQRGIVPDMTSDYSRASIIFVQRDKRAYKVPYSEVYNVNSAKSRLTSELLSINVDVNVDSILTLVGVYNFIEPNLIYDSETTDLVHAENVDYISPTMGFVNAGQLIVSEGELVTAEIQQMLDSYKSEYENSLGYSGPVFLLWLKNVLLAFVVLVILFLSIFYTNPGVLEEYNRFVYLVFIFALSASATLLVEKADPEYLYMVPFTLTALFLLAFFKTRVVLPVYIVSLTPLLVFSHNGVELFVMYLASGVITMYLYPSLNRGWRQFLMCFVSYIVVLLTYLGFCLGNDNAQLVNINRIYLLFFGAILPVAGYPFIFLFEKVFMLVSNNRLQELCDTNNKLIVELAQKAPGTFQHSLQVMNMSDAVASAIGANSLLARTGALYHDVGKLGNPLCFIENATMGTDYHSELSPIESSKEILRHVPEGMEIAEKFAIPQTIKEFILTHHGTSSTAYFLNKYLNEGGDPQHSSEFYYKGVKPWTKEQSIVMLCDTIEAASRTLKDNKPETYDDFVEKIVSSKINDGQLSEANITLKELEEIKSCLKNYLAKMYHDRIVYPKRKKGSN